ncbi:hypothetical protein [Motilimonas pumila]|uniref:MFS transporter n=1 Tax=Motilimonas pumila TaxID=2303987 RepID=A0A418YBM0_9GAMM|nr:hypothetical protein [Motilimonas pumila]RJG41905.1 hypothetical protein D1Z90_15545 [Motilimonas pumila]
MGLIIAPIWLFWLGTTGFMLYLGWGEVKQLGSWQTSLLTALLMLVASLVLAMLYVRYQLQPLASKTELWAFEIAMRLLFNWVPLVIVLGAWAIRYFNQFWQFPYLSVVAVTIGFAIAAGTLIGPMLSERFMDQHEIRRTY